MTFEEYWHQRTIDEDDMIYGLWVGKGEVSNNLYHMLRRFAREIWKAANQEFKADKTEKSFTP